MGELFNAIKAEASRPPKSSRIDQKLREHLGDAGWKDFEKACKDQSISTSAICRVIKAQGFPVSYSAISRIRTDFLKS